MGRNDPGLMTDSTGEGMAGTQDVRYSTQQELKETTYNGSRTCKGCGLYTMNPLQALYGELCPHCKRKQARQHVEGGMA